MMQRLLRMIEQSTSIDELTEALTEATLQMGFHNFALTHHVDLTSAQPSAVRLHNYPEQWVEHYDRNALVFRDPVHRASHVTSVGFAWARLPDMVALTAADERMLAMGREQGIGEGFTVPAHVPGEARGSVSFVVRTGASFPQDLLPVAQLIGNFGFEAARRLCTARGHRDGARQPQLTDRQRDCVLWAAQGKSDPEIAIILAISRETVTEHVSQACERYGVSKRTSLIIRTLFDGTVTFTEVLRGRYPHFWG